MIPFDMLSIITYCRSLVAIDLSLVVFDIFDFEKISSNFLFGPVAPSNPDQGSLQFIKTGIIQQIGYGFLLVFYRKFVPKTNRF